MEKNYFASIEFGSIFTSVVIVSYSQNKTYVVGALRVQTQGYKDGVILNHEVFKESINKVKSEIKNVYKINFDEVILVLPNNNHKVYSASVTNKVMTERQIIGKAQIDALRNQIKSAKMDEGSILIEEDPISYVLDDNRESRTAPIGFQSSTIQIKSNIHTLNKGIVDDLINTLRECQITVLSYFMNCACGAFINSDNYALEGECIHINFGQESTSISAFTKSLLLKSTKLDFGYENLLKHLKEQLNVDLKTAYNLFESYFVADIEKCSDIVLDEQLNITERKISGTILYEFNEHMDEILNACSQLASEVNFSHEYFILITGWLNDYESFVTSFAKNCNLRVQEGLIDVVGLNSQSFVNCWGAIKLFVDRNTQYIVKRIEREENVMLEELQTNEKPESDTVVKEQNSGSRFKDIFDE